MSSKRSSEPLETATPILPLGKPYWFLSMLYTILMEYRGGTYASQVEAEGVAPALRTWVASLDRQTVAELGSVRQAELNQRISERLADGYGPVRLDGLVNAWCATVLLSDELIVINIVATVQLPCK